MKAKDLAKQLGVSPATISLVLNNKPGISNSLRHSLIEKIRELGCGNMLASEGEARAESENLCRSRPGIAYLIYTNSDEQDDKFAFYPAVLEGAEMEARDHCYNLMVLHMNPDGDNNLCQLLPECCEIIGVIVQASMITPAILEDVKNLTVPCVFVDAYLPDKKLNCVCVNNEQGIFSAVSYLKEQGHTRLGYVSSGRDSNSLLERRRYFHQALREYGLEDHRRYYYNSHGQGADSFERLCKIWREASDLPTALMVENDLLAWRVIKSLERSGFRVPQDVSVVGFDDRSICTMIEPTLTSVKHYRHLMGRECIMTIKNLQHMMKMGVEKPSLKMELPTELIIRESVAPPKN